MIYDLKDDFQREQARARLSHLEGRKSVVEITEKRARSLQQSRYIHLCIFYLAAVLGERADYVKSRYFKYLCNKDIFLRTRNDSRAGGEVRFLRSISDITKEEASVAIERFRTWSSEACGIYIPSSDEHNYLLQMEIETNRNNKWI